MSGAVRRGLATAVVLGLVAAALVYAFWPRPAPVDMAAVERRALAVTVDEEARTRVTDLYVVSAPVAGRLLRLDREVGDPITAGETVLATILPSAPAFLDRRTRAEREAAVRAAEASLDLARAEVARAEAEREYAERELARAERLAQRGTISEATLEARQMAARTTEAALAEARAALEVARFRLETAQAAMIDPLDTAMETPEGACCVNVRAPVDGRVLRLLQESESVVDAGTPLVEVGDPRRLEIVAELLSADAVGVVPGAPVSIEDWGGGPLEGRVRRVEPFGFTKVSALGIEEQRVNVVIDLADGPDATPAGLGHGFRVTVRIRTDHLPDALVVPQGALFRHEGDWAVFVVADGRAERRAVTLGPANQEAAAVAEGLAEGERVVLYPGERVGEGTRVTARAAAE
ncbi:MAG: HlyD family efflux transporter periplasmic adaptor subunit [Azospirillaceae bacterium]